ncbi:MAG: 50S ribosomal protein L11 methyltransferase [Planctomycetes bacterium]|nr:50S ribosomal protein L11 methyltransferase [Planctomycetota bacterium]
MSTLGWTEIRVLVPLGWEELVAETLNLGPCSSVAFGRPTLASAPAPEGFEYVRTFVASTSDTPELRAQVRNSLDELAARAEIDELAGLALEFRELPPEDYANSWRKVWKPFRVGRLAVIAPWKESVLRAHDLRLELEPGGAFGSGRHATTRMCMKVLQERLRPGSRLIDAGSGSGILTVSAALLGAREAIGFDIDPNAQPWAEQLARKNGAVDRARFLTAGFECLPALGKFDALLANIYSDVVIEHVAKLREALEPGGWFAFSGCPLQHVEATRAAIVASGLQLEEVRARGRWHTFAGIR